MEYSSDVVEAKGPGIEQATGMIATSGMLEVLLDHALRRPRNDQIAMEKALEELRIVPDLAEKAYYSIPYKDGEKTTPVEGPTIGTAMTLARFRGNQISGGRIVSEDENGYDVEGFSLDLETMNLIGRPYRVSKFYKPRGSQSQVRLTPDKKLMAVQSGISKAIRNAVIRNTPDWMIEKYLETARQLVLNPPKAKKTKSIQERLIDAKNHFRKVYGVTDEEMTDYLSGLSECETDDDILVHLVGLNTALKEKHKDVDEVFGRTKPESQIPQEQ